MGLFAKKTLTTFEEPAAESAPVETDTTPEPPEGYEETVTLLAAATATLAERIGGAQASDRGGPQWPAVWALTRAAAKLNALHSDPRLVPILETLTRLVGQTSPLPDGETLPRILKRLGLQNRGEFSAESATLIRRLDLPAHSEFGDQAELLRGAQRRQEIWLAEREAAALQRAIDEQDQPRRRLAEVRQRIASLEAAGASS